MIVTNPAFWANPIDESVRVALAGMDTSLTLPEAKVELPRQLLERWRAWEAGSDEAAADRQSQARA